MTSQFRSPIAAFFALITTLVVACAPGTNDPDNENLQGADETTATGEDGLSGNIAVGTKLVSTANVNLRTGPSTSNSIKYTIPNGSTVVVQEAAPQNGFYKVKHNGTIGWSYGAYYEISAPPPVDDDGGSDPVSDVRQQAILRAKSGVGFSYWWGHGRFRADGPTSSTKGSCSGSCPNCSHSGSYGGDCSGYAAKVWAVPGSNNDIADDEHPYSTADFVQNTSNWSIISRDALQQADAMVYRQNGAGHIFIYDHGDAWGSPYAYECKSCSGGCVAGTRSVSSAYKAIRRTGW
ncbi:MAG: SH3 domain-containing protein [Polyangiaceae bacterium]|nr:SH3 domain-containing protein [Polyangiaceae bacterium]